MCAYCVYGARHAASKHTDTAQDPQNHDLLGKIVQGEGLFLFISFPIYLGGGVASDRYS